MTTDTCPDVHLHRMLGLGFIVWLASSLVAACAPVSFHLHRKDNVLKSIVLILFGLHKSLLLIHFPNHLAVFCSFGCPSQIISSPKMDSTDASNPSTSFFSSYSSIPVVSSLFFIWSLMISWIWSINFEAWPVPGAWAIVPVSR